MENNHFYSLNPIVMENYPRPHKRPNPALVTIASKVRQFRLKKNCSQTELADILEVSQPAYERKEAGFYRFKREELGKLAQFFQIPIWEFYWDHSLQQAFYDFAREKGFIPVETFQKKMEFHRARVNLLEKEVERLLELNKILKDHNDSLKKALKL